MTSRRKPQGRVLAAVSGKHAGNHRDLPAARASAVMAGIRRCSSPANRHPDGFRFCVTQAEEGESAYFLPVSEKLP